MGSRRISVVKRDSSIEPFDRNKLRSCLLRALMPSPKAIEYAEVVSSAVRRFLVRRSQRCISSAALLEMALTALRAAGLAEAAASMEQAHARRNSLRSQLRLHHDQGPPSAWSKSWLAQHARRDCRVSRNVARFLAGQVEQHLLAAGQPDVSRESAMQALGQIAAEYGLVCQLPQPAEG